MTLSSYDAVIEDSAREARGREQQALNHGIALLKRFQSGDIPPSEGAEALLYIRRLWTFFVEDLSQPAEWPAGKAACRTHLDRPVDHQGSGPHPAGRVHRRRRTRGDQYRHPRRARMKKPMCISLRGGERIYVNGAVLRVDRKVTLELINDVAFLLENQVMQVADATTPLRQLYFVVQLMLMSPHDVEEAKARLSGAAMRFGGRVRESGDAARSGGDRRAGRSQTVLRRLAKNSHAIRHRAIDPGRGRIGQMPSKLPEMRRRTT